jgi:hypothetical protein
MNLKPLCRRFAIRLPLLGNRLARLVTRQDVCSLGQCTFVWVAPESICGDVLTRHFSRDPMWFLQNGKWSERAGSLQDSGVFRLFEVLLASGTACFEETAIYRELVKKAEGPEGFKSNRGLLRSRKQIDCYLKRQFELFTKMNTPGFFDIDCHAIPVVAGAEGHLFRCGDGKHRHIFAALGGMAQVKVRIINLHETFFLKSVGGCRYRSALSKIQWALAELAKFQGERIQLAVGSLPCD